MDKISKARVHFCPLKSKFFFSKIPEIKLLKLIRGTELPSLGPRPCMVFSKNVPKVVLRYRDLKFARV